MSIGPMSLPAAVAGAPLAQSRGETDRGHQDAAAQDRHTAAGEKAEAASGIGATDENSEASDRDADGRRLWEFPEQPPSEDAATEASHRIADPSGQLGAHLDIEG